MDENKIFNEEIKTVDNENSTNKAKRKKIIYVDDVQFMLLSVKDRLKKHYEVFPAKTAEILFEILVNITPDLILLDINMPQVDGFEIAKRLKNDSNYEDIPIIFLTGKTDKESVVKAIEHGAVDILFKPVSDAKLLESINYQFDLQMQIDNKPVVLAVDDSPSILKSVNYTLKDRYKVYTLPYSERIKDVLKLTEPDLFLLDCNMPKLSGFDLINIIREDPVHEETPIMFLTSENDHDTIFSAIGLGVCDYIIKPIDEKILHEKIAAHTKDFINRRLIRSTVR